MGDDIPGSSLHRECSGLKPFYHESTVNHVFSDAKKSLGNPIFETRCNTMSYMKLVSNRKNNRETTPQYNISGNHATEVEN